MVIGVVDGEFWDVGGVEVSGVDDYVVWMVWFIVVDYIWVGEFFDFIKYWCDFIVF